MVTAAIMNVHVRDNLEAIAGTAGGIKGGAGGLTGATAATRYVGGTASGAPTSGTFAVGDFVIAQDGKVWVCTTAGTPGTWTQVGGALTTAEAALAADASLSTANAFVDGPSVSLAAGTWLLVAKVRVQKLTNAGRLTAKLWDGTTTEDLAEIYLDLSEGEAMLPLAGIVAPASTTTYKVSVAPDSAGGNIKSTSTSNGGGSNTASRLVGIKVA